MMRRLPVFLGALGLVLGCAGFVRAETLSEALAAAYASNPGLKAERAKLRAVDEQVPQALSGFRPTLEASGDVTREDTLNNRRSTGGGKEQIRTPRGTDFTVAQPLYQGGRTTAALGEAENKVRAARARLTSKEQEVLLAAVNAFMDVIRDQAVLNLNINNEQVLRRQLEATLDRFQVGEITRTDVSQAEARLAGATADRIQSEGNLEISRAAYLNVIGLAPSTLLAPKKFSHELPADKKSASDAAREVHPDVSAALFDERAAKDNIEKVRGELRPELSLNGTVAYDVEASGNTSRSVERSIGATLKIPLYQAGAVYSRLREAKQTAGEARLLVDQARRDVLAQAARAWEQLATARARIKSFKAQVEASEIALEGVEREAAVGSRTVLDTLDAKQELLDARVNLVTAERDETVAQYGLLSAVGRLTARDLDLPAEIYDPEKHYREVRGKWVGTESSGEGGSLKIPETDALKKPGSMAK